MGRTRGASTKPTAKMKWLTVQITEKQNSVLEQYCSETCTTKADAVRDILNNIEFYKAYQEDLKRSLLPLKLREHFQK